jgi:hypothetical protein
VILYHNNPNELQIVPFFPVDHPNGYFTITTTALPLHWTLPDVLDALNMLYGGDDCHFIGGKEYENKASDSVYKYAFIHTDNRIRAEELIETRTVKVSSDPDINIIIKRAPDRSNAELTLKATNIPHWYNEKNVKRAIEHYSGLTQSVIDHVFIPEDHETGEISEYCYIRMCTEPSYNRVLDTCKGGVLFHDNKVYITPSNDRKGKSPATPKSNYRPPSPDSTASVTSMTDTRSSSRNSINNNSNRYNAGPSSQRNYPPTPIPVAGSSTDTTLVTEVMSITATIREELSKAVKELRQDIKEQVSSLRDEIYNNLGPQDDAEVDMEDVVVADTPASSPRADSPTAPDSKKQKK